MKKPPKHLDWKKWYFLLYTIFFLCLTIFATVNSVFKNLTLNTFSSHATYSLWIPRDFPKDAKINIETRTMIKGGRKKL